MSNHLTISTSERETPISKKRDISSPLYDSVDTYKKYKHHGECDSSLISISESQLDTDTGIHIRNIYIMVNLIVLLLVLLNLSLIRIRGYI